MSDFNAMQQIPDLRFEEVFMKSFNESGGSLMGVVRILILDQVGVLSRKCGGCCVLRQLHHKSVAPSTQPTIPNQVILPLIQGSLWGVGVSVVKSLLL